MDKKTNITILSVVAAVIVFLVSVTVMNKPYVPIAVVTLLSLVLAATVGICVHIYFQWNTAEEAAVIKKVGSKKIVKEQKCCSDSLIHKGFKFGLGFWLSLLLIYVILALIIFIFFGFRTGSHMGWR